MQIVALFVVAYYISTERQHFLLYTKTNENEILEKKTRTEQVVFRPVIHFIAQKQL